MVVEIKPIEMVRKVNEGVELPFTMVRNEMKQPGKVDSVGNQYMMEMN